MVKFSNRGKGKPTKRKTLKTKYKIQRKVAQHKKKLRRQAKRLHAKGIRPGKKKDRDPLPNAFPFKQDIVREYIERVAPPIDVAMKPMDTTCFGFKTLENISPYLPRSKDILLKKYINNMEAALLLCDVVIETVDPRDPTICVNEEFRKACKARGATVMTVITKIDTINEDLIAEATKQLNNLKSCLKPPIFHFTTDSKRRRQLLQLLMKQIRQLRPDYIKHVLIAGKPFTGKHTLLHNFLKYSNKAHDNNLQLFQIQLHPNIKLVDAPLHLLDGSKYPLFWQPSATDTESSLAQEERILGWLLLGGYHRSDTDKSKPRVLSGLITNDHVLQHYMIENYTSLDDALKKVGRVNRLYGKGGMVDLARVRRLILGDWYAGRLNGAVTKVGEA